MIKVFKYSGLATLVLALFAATSSADTINVDQVLYQSGGVADASLLSGTVNMTLVGNVLTITLTNTSQDGAGDGAGILLTGIGFQLPTGVSISATGDTAVIATGSTAVNFAGGAGTNVSQEWGFDANPLNSGVFQSGITGLLSYNSVVGSMESITTDQFASGSLGGSPGLNGPDFGLISAKETGSIGNQAAIRDSIVITLNLSGTIPSNLLTTINNGNVGLSFGSPDTVPEPATSALLALPCLAGLFFFRRKQAVSVR
jgi:hypothetical protein